MAAVRLFSRVDQALFADRYVAMIKAVGAQPEFTGGTTPTPDPPTPIDLARTDITLDRTDITLDQLED